MIKLKTASSVFVFLVLAFVFLAGVYRLNDTLFFYADQGSDAERVWRIWHEKRLILAGTETSVGSLVRIGPFFYYLLAPFYTLGSGNPVHPAVFLALIWTLGIYLIYLFAKRAFNYKTAWLVLLLAGTSHYMTVFSRWLSNPNPSVLLSTILLFVMYQIMNKKSPFLWILSAFLVGLLFHFQAASGFFYVFVLIAFSFWQKKQGLNLKTLVLMTIVFTLTFVPLLVHNFQNNNMLLRGISNYVLSEGAFGTEDIEGSPDKVLFVRTAFRRLFFPTRWGLASFWFLTLIGVTLLKLKVLLANRYFKMLLIILLSPILPLIFFQDILRVYYFSAFFVPLFLALSFMLSETAKNTWGKILLFTFLASFLVVNLRQTQFYLKKSVDDPQNVSFKNQKEAVAWIAEDATQSEVDVKIFVPDKQTNGLDYEHPYRYLLLHKGYNVVNQLGECLEETGRNGRTWFETFYVIREFDPFAERIENWLSCQKIDETELLESATFGGITVEKRMVKQSL